MNHSEELKIIDEGSFLGYLLYKREKVDLDFTLWQIFEIPVFQDWIFLDYCNHHLSASVGCFLKPEICWFSYLIHKEFWTVASTISQLQWDVSKFLKYAYCHVWFVGILYGSCLPFWRGDLCLHESHISLNGEDFEVVKDFRYKRRLGNVKVDSGVMQARRVWVPWESLWKWSLV